MSLWTYRRSSAFKRPSDIVLRWSDLTNPRAELARSTDAVVTGVTSSSFRTCRTFGNKSSCPETLVFSLFFLFFFFFCRYGGGGVLAPPPPPWIRYWTVCAWPCHPVLCLLLGRRSLTCSRTIQDSRRPLKICDRLGSVFSLLDFHVDHSNGIEFV